MRLKLLTVLAALLLCTMVFTGCKDRIGDTAEEEEKFTVTFGVEGEGGTLEALLDGKTYTDGTLQAQSGKTVIFTAKPGGYFKVESWQGLKAVPADAETAVLKITKAQDVKVKFVSDKSDRVFTVEGVDFKMKYIEEVSSGTLGGAKEEDNPAHEVSLSAYLIGETEVTQELYQAVMMSNPAVFDGETLLGKPPKPTVAAEGEEQKKRPVEMVNWYAAVIFCNILTEKIMGGSERVYSINNIEEKKGETGNKKKPDRIIKAEVTADWSKKGFRLPTEAEWEWAAKGGGNDIYGGANNIDGLKKIAWFKGNSDYKSHQTAIKTPNGYGLYDMNGNVWEWCWDWYVKPLPKEKQHNPKGAETGMYKVSRGGSWYTSETGCTNEFRASTHPAFLENFQGLRLVCIP